MRNVIIDEHTIIKAAQQYGTPCLCYEEREIEYWKKRLLAALPENAKLIYSVKASASPVLLENYIRSGFFFETASVGELLILLNYGASPNKIWVSGQGKTREYIETAVSNNITHFHLESVRELFLLGPIIQEKKGYECCLRINPAEMEVCSVLQTGGNPSAFGVDEEIMERVLKSQYGDIITGIFLYAGSQLFYCEDIIKNTEYAFTLAEKFYSITGKTISSIDFGGGFGVPEKDCFPEDGIRMTELDIEALKSSFSGLFERHCKSSCFSDNTGFYFEIGRYLAARTACLITSVVDVKESKDKKFVITDGGINQLGVKQMEYRLYPPYIKHVGKNSAGDRELYTIMGNTCTTIDMTHPEVFMGPVSVGDYICIMDCGAYSVEFSPQKFNGRYEIPEVLHTGDKVVGFRDRGSIYSLTKTDNYIPLNSGNEIRKLLLKSCPKDSDEVQNIAIAASAIRINRWKCLIYDVSADGVQTIILLKILKKHYDIVPDVVFTDAPKTSIYTKTTCYPLARYNTWAAITEDISSVLTR